MKTIYKYNINLQGSSLILPKGAKILSAQAQSCSLCLWAEIDTNADREERFFEVYGTGHQIIDNHGKRKFIATVQIEGFVWHVFERVNATI